MPVFKTNIDNVIGFFHIKDFIKMTPGDFNMNKILRELLYVAPKSPILDLLKTMRSSRIHIGLVVDGVGGVDGLVTIEDLVEEIVGDLEDLFKIKISRSEEDELFTVGGLVYSKINRIPNNNEIIKTDDNLEIKILKSNNRKIETVEIKKIN